MMPISIRRLLQNRLGKQALPPQRYQPTRIEMHGMNAPETQTRIFNADRPFGYKSGMEPMDPGRTR